MASFLQNLNDKVRKAQADIAPKASQFRDQVSEKFNDLYTGANNNELYLEDERLEASVNSLNSIRKSFKDIVTAVNQHYNHLRAQAEAQRLMGEKILQVSVFEKYYTQDAILAHLAVGRAETNAAAVVEKFAQDMNTPLQELNRKYEETYAKQILPLRKRYTTQKSDYLKYKHQLEREADEGKRSNLEALAQAAIPVWQATSEQLQADGDRLAGELARSLSEWTFKMISMHHDMVRSLSDTFDDAHKHVQAQG